MAQRATFVACVATLVAAARTTPTRDHLHARYEASRARCTHGQRGVIILLHEDSMTPDRFAEELGKYEGNKGSLGHVFSAPHTIRGVSAKLSNATLLHVMRKSEEYRVSSVHANCLRHMTWSPATHFFQSKAVNLVGDVSSNADVAADTISGGVEKRTTNWGLDRADQVDDNTNGEYTFKGATGEGTILYQIDTGVRMSDPEFAELDATGSPVGSRIRHGFSMGCTYPIQQQEACSTLWVADANITDSVLERNYRVPDDPTTDEDESLGNYHKGCDGHGTHTLSVAIGNRFGVAKKAKAVVIQGLSCASTAEDSLVVKALEWVVTDARSRKPYQPAVVLMSLGGDDDVVLDEAVKRTTLHGVHVTVASGNDGSDACQMTPADVGRANTVSAVGAGMFLSTFSNYGKCVDLLAPGDNIAGSYPVLGERGAVRTLSGTSMATPFVAGALLQALQYFPHMTTEEGKQLLRCTATQGVARNVGHTPNLFVRIGQAYTDAQSMAAATRESHEHALGTQQKGSIAAAEFETTLTARLHGCLSLIQKLNATRPAGGILQTSPDVLEEHVMPSDDWHRHHTEKDKPVGSPYTKAAAASIPGSARAQQKRRVHGKRSGLIPASVWSEA